MQVKYIILETEKINSIRLMLIELFLFVYFCPVCSNI